MTRITKAPTVRKVSKSDGRMARYAELKTLTGIVLPEVKKVLLDRHKDESPSRRRFIMYPSEMSLSDWCPRGTYYRMCGYPEPPSNNSFQMENVFAHGNQVHSKWQDWLSDTGKLWGDWRCFRCGAYIKDSLKPKNPGDGVGVYTPCTGTEWVSLNGGTLFEQQNFSHSWTYKEVTLKSSSLPMSGHADGALVEHNSLIEFKSLGVGSLRFSAPTLLEQHTYTVQDRRIIDIDGLWRDFHRPLPSHVRQGNLYLWMCKEMGLPFNRISFIYEFKPNNQVKEFILPYSEDIVAPMLTIARTVVEAVSSKIPPPCPKGGCPECRKYEKAER